MDNVQLIKFEAVPVPEFKEKKINGKDWIGWGESNDYPIELLNLYENSSYHNAIIGGKARYIKGKGFAVKEEGLTTQDIAVLSEVIKNPNTEDSLNEILEKIALDLEIYGGFALEIVWDRIQRLGTINYIGIEKLRRNENGSKFYFSEDWKNSRQGEHTKFAILNPFNPSLRLGKQIFFYSEPRKGAKLYPKPGYIGGIKAIKTDAEITNFHYNNINNSFSANTILSFNNGVPTQDEQKEIKAKVKAKHTGTDNAGELIVTFSDSKEKAPEVISLSGGDFDKKYEALDKSTQQKIFTCHGVVSPMLFGIKTEGQLGGRTEIIEAFELLQNGYITPKQQRIEECFNYLLSFKGVKGGLYIMPTEPLGYKIPEQEVIKVMSRAEIREKAGLPPEEQQLRSQFSQDNVLKIFKSFGRPKSEVQLHKVHQRTNSREDAVINEINLYRHGFAVEVSDNQKSILDLLKKDSKINEAELAKALKLPLEEVYKEVQGIREKGLIQGEIGDVIITETAENILKNEEIPTETLEIVYSYEVRDGVPPAKESREFCKELMSLNRVYTRQEIDKISELVDRDVWRERGGFYYNPKTDQTTSHCRHVWQQNIIRKKNG